MKKIFLSKSKGKKAFTLIEILVAILILTIIIVTGFELYTKAIASKVKIDEQANLEKNIYYFSEKIFQLIKKGGTLDYEEYFNRRLVSSIYPNPWYSITFDYKTLTDGHYTENTGFGNFGFGGNIGTPNYGAGFYYCTLRSGQIILYGCFRNTGINTNSKNIGGVGIDYFGKPQRYGQYSFNFIDYNSDGNDDGGDTDGDGNIMRDDDDKHLGQGPAAFSENSDLKELYLLSGDKKTRTLIRWNIKQDEFAKTRNNSFNCNSSLNYDSAKKTWSPANPTNFSYCHGTIEFLQLEGKDWGLDHNDTIIDSDGTQNDGVVDTWLIASNFSGKENKTYANSIIAGSGNVNYRKPLFNDSINISDFKVFAYPNIDSSKVWDLTLEQQKKFLISPYVILYFEIRPTWKVKSKISGGEIKPVRFNMTVNLTEVFSK